MKKGFVFTATLAALTLGLVACGGGGGSDVPDVKITNKDELQTEWYVEDDDRGITMSIEGVRISDAIDAGDLVVTSSNPAVATIDQTTFRKVHAVGVGKTTVSAVYKNAKSDSVEIEVKARPTYRVATTLDPDKDDYKLRWYIGPKAYYAAGTKGKVDSGNPYYLDPADSLDGAMDLSVSEENINSPYRYSITFSNGSTIGQKRDSSHCNIGFTSESGYAKTLFKLNSDYSLSCLIPVGDATATEADEYFLAVYSGTNAKRLAFQKGTGIPAVGFARIIELGDPIPATGITLSAESLSLKDGQAGKLTATVEPATSTDVVAWESNAPTTAYVEDGRILALKEGTAVITAKAGNATATCTVTISGSINYGSEEAPLTPEEAHDLLENNFKDGSQTVKMMVVRGVVHSVSKTWQDSNAYTCKLEKSDGSAFVDKYFTVYGGYPAENVDNPEEGDTIIAKGYAKIMGEEYEIAPGKAPGAEKNTNASIVSVTKGVPPTLTGIEVTPEETTVNLYEKTEAVKVQLTAAPVPAKATLGEVSWTSSDAAVEVSDAGLVTIPADYVALDGEPKTVTITVAKADDDNIKDTALITVKNKQEVAPATISFTAADFNASTASFTTASATKDGLTISFTKAKGATYDGHTQLRVTKGADSTMTFSGKTVTKIEFVCELDYTDKDGKVSPYGVDGFKASVGTITKGAVGEKSQAGTWEGESSSLVLTASEHQVRIVSFVVTVAAE